MKKKQAKAAVTNSYFKDKVEIDSNTIEEVLDVRVFETEPALVGVEYGLTLNLGNLNSGKISISAVVPCYTEEMDEAYDFASKWVAKRIEKEAAEMRGKTQLRKGDY